MKTESENQIEQIELDINTAKERIANAEALQRLHQNKDFRSLILDKYFVQEASRAVLLKADPSVKGKEEQRQIRDFMIGIGQLRQWFGTVYGLGNGAQQAMDDMHKAKQEILEEQLEEGTIQ